MLRRHPWIFSGAIAAEHAKDQGAAASAPPVLQLCEVTVKSAKGETLGEGVYSPASQIRVRLRFGDTVEELVAKALARRTITATSGMRLINAENDLLPGVIADWYAGHIVLQLTSAFAEFYKPRILAALRKGLSLLQGASASAPPVLLSLSERTDLDARRKEGLLVPPAVPQWRLIEGAEPPALVEIEENGIRFLVDIREGHKTGFYLDQREARALVGRLAKGRRALNCFSYTGGFGLYALRGGATEVTQVDISGPALALAKRNLELNLAGCAEAPRPPMEFVEADVFKYLRSCRDARKTFDLIVLDPPKFAESKAQLMKAARGYKDINLLAMKLLAPGGLLATFSCSGAMTPEFFDTILAEAAVDAKRDFQMIARTRQAEDHPVALGFPEGLYLKGVILRAND